MKTLLLSFIPVLLFASIYACDTFFPKHSEDEPLDGYYWDLDSTEKVASYKNYYGELAEKYELDLKFGDYHKHIKFDSVSEYIYIDSVLTENKIYDIAISAKRQNASNWFFKVVLYSKAGDRWWENKIQFAGKETTTDLITDKFKFTPGYTIIYISLRKFDSP